MQSRIYFITATDTGVGKTVLTLALLRRQRDLKRSVIGLKPFSSGDRDDAIAIRSASGTGVALNEINPWHFSDALAPLVAARAARRTISGRDVLHFIKSMAAQYKLTLVEGAGGLLTPLAKGVDASSLLASLRAIPIVVCPNRLGAINQALLAMQALPGAQARHARLVLMRQRKKDHSAPSNFEYLREALGKRRVFDFPRLPARVVAGRQPMDRSTLRVLDRLIG